MKNEIAEYKTALKNTIKDNSADTDWNELSETLLRRIEFYQHERLIHLIVTMTFAVMTVISFGLMCIKAEFVLLALLFLALTIPYIFHYYFLENSVQEMYELYYKVYAKSKEKQK